MPEFGFKFVLEADSLTLAPLGPSLPGPPCASPLPAGTTKSVTISALIQFDFQFLPEPPPAAATKFDTKIPAKIFMRFVEVKRLPAKISRPGKKGGPSSGAFRGTLRDTLRATNRGTR